MLNLFFRVAHIRGKRLQQRSPHSEALSCSLDACHKATSLAGWILVVSQTRPSHISYSVSKSEAQARSRISLNLLSMPFWIKRNPSVSDESSIMVFAKLLIASRTS